MGFWLEYLLLEFGGENVIVLKKLVIMRKYDDGIV